MIDRGYSEEFLKWMEEQYNASGSKVWWIREVLENILGRFMFEAWQAGRQELIEAQKPECKLYKILLTSRSYEWGVSSTSGEFSTTEGFASEAEATEWAEAHGCRVKDTKERKPC